MSGRWEGRSSRGPLALGVRGRTGVSDRAAAFIDRDGVLNEAVLDPDSGLLESPLRVADVRLLPRAAGALRELAEAGYAVVCASNQPAAAKGKASLGELVAVHERVIELLAREDIGEVFLGRTSGQASSPAASGGRG